MSSDGPSKEVVSTRRRSLQRMQEASYAVFYAHWKEFEPVTHIIPPDPRQHSVRHWRFLCRQYRDALKAFREKWGEPVSF